MWPSVAYASGSESTLLLRHAFFRRRHRQLDVHLDAGPQEDDVHFFLGLMVPERSFDVEAVAHRIVTEPNDLVALAETGGCSGRAVRDFLDHDNRSPGPRGLLHVHLA